MGVYAPHMSRKVFFQQLIKDLAQFEEGTMVLMGNLNGIMDERLDKSSLTVLHTGLPKEFKYWLNDSSLIDVWRNQHGNLWEYSYYLGCHNSYSCIDYVFQTKSNIVRVCGSTIGPRVYSDHAAVVIEWGIYGPLRLTKFWKLDNYLILNQSVVSYIQKELTNQGDFY